VQAHKPNLVSTDIRLSDALQTSLSEIAQQWNCTATLALRPQDVSVPRPLAAQLSLMLAEAVANAARHGGASKVDVNIETAQDRLLVNIRDNGRGFHNPSLADPAGTASVLEPRSLYERVAELGGVLNVSSSPSGVDLEIRVPL
jgi:signal transduction histidine kinase